MFDSPYDRAFGVEIECGFPTGVYGAEDLISSAWEDAWNKGWSVGSDGTDVEIRTPILEGEEGYEILKRTMALIRERGGYVTPADGMHVHHDAPDFAAEPALVVPLVESWRRNKTSIDALVTPRRRGNYGACPEWSDMAFEALKAWAEGREQYLRVGRNDLNVASLQRNRPSIEIRLHEGTLDGDVAVSWVQFGQKFLNDVTKLKGRRLRKRDTDELLLDRIKLTPEATAILLAKKQYDFVTPDMNFWIRRKPREQFVRERVEVEADYDEYDDDYCDCEMCRGEN